MKIGDFLIVVFVIVLIIFIFIRQLNENIFMTDNLKAQILVDGNLVEEIFLDNVDSPYSFSPKGATGVIIFVKHGKIRFLESQCQDKICILNGWLNNAGQASVCLPTKTLVRITGTKQLDSIAY